MMAEFSKFNPTVILVGYLIMVAILLIFNMVAILTIYPAMLSVDLIRRKSNRMDIFCCFKASIKDRLIKPVLSATSSSSSDSSNENYDSETPPTSGKQENDGITVESSTAVDGRKRRKSMSFSIGAKSGRPSRLSSVYHHFSDSGYSLSNCSCCPKNCPVGECRGGGVSDGVTVPSTCHKHTRHHSDLDKLVLSAQQTPNFDDDVEVRDSPTAGCCLQPISGFTLQRLTERCYAKLLTKTSVKVLVLLIHTCLLSFGIIGCNHIKLGLELTDVLPKNTPPYAFLETRQAYFSFYPFNIVVRGPLDLANNQHLLRKFRDSINEIPYIVKSDQNHHHHNLPSNPSISQTGSSSQFWLQLMSEWLTDLQAKFDSDFEAGLITRQGLVQNKTEFVSPEAILAYKLLCNHGDEISRSRVGNTRLVDKDGLINPDGFYNYLTAWYHADPMTYYVSQANLYPGPPFWKNDDKLRQNNIKIPPAPVPVYSQIPFFLNDLVDTPSIVDMIVVLVLIMLVVELAGFMGIVGLKLNAVSGVSLITAVGIGVEFTVHVAFSFLTSIGSRNRRTTLTLEHVCVPVFHGGLSTLLGVIMLAFSEFEFIFRYFFMVLSALIVLGLFNGLCVLPVLLSIMGPKSEVRTIDGSDHLDPPSPPPVPSATFSENAATIVVQ